MLRQIARLVLLVALLATLVVSSVPAFAGGCHFDKKTSQCVNNGCFVCFLSAPDKCHCFFSL